MNPNEIVEKIIAQAESTQRRLTVRLEDLQTEMQQAQAQLKSVESEIKELRKSLEPAE